MPVGQQIGANIYTEVINICQKLDGQQLSCMYFNMLPSPHEHTHKNNAQLSKGEHLCKLIKHLIPTKYAFAYFAAVSNTVPQPVFIQI